MSRITLILAMALFNGLSATAQETSGGNQEVLRRLDKVSSELGNHQYSLRYQFQPEQQMAYEVEHLVRVKTTIDGVSQSQQSRSTSQKSWKVTAVDAKGNATFTHSIDWVNMWSEAQGQAPVIYDSRQDAEPPADYVGVAESLGKVLATVTVDTQGAVVRRDDKVNQIDMGTGEILMPLPQQPIRIGESWAVTKEVPVRLADGAFKAIKTRMRYRLEKVETGVATISLKTQVISTDITPRVQSQLIQKLSNGTLKFDLDAGRLLSKQLEWDETVVGFNGPSSNMSYLGKITERYVDQARVATRQ